MSKSDGVHEEGGVCARCGGLVFDPVIPQKRHEWVGLTDEQLDDIYYCVEGGKNALETWREQARAVEAKLKEKNT